MQAKHSLRPGTVWAALQTIFFSVQVASTVICTQNYSRTPIKWPPIKRPAPIRRPVIKVLMRVLSLLFYLYLVATIHLPEGGRQESMKYFMLSFGRLIAVELYSLIILSKIRMWRHAHWQLTRPDGLLLYLPRLRAMKKQSLNANRNT